MRSRLLTLAGAGALVLTLAACGDSDGGDGGDDGGAAAGDCSPATANVTVGALDALEFDNDAYDAEAGCIQFTYRNEGNLAHTLLIKEQSGFKLKVGDTDEGVIELEPGTYELFCDVAGHEAGGMTAELTVS